MNLSENIYTLRTGRGMSQEDLARHLEVSRQSVSKWETGSAVPDLDKLMNMSQLFGITLDELVGGEPASPVQSQAPAAPQDNTQRTCGLLLTAGGLLVLLLLSLLGGPAIGLLFSVPLLVPGIICLLSKRHTVLKCSWAEFVLLSGFLSFTMGTNWKTLWHFLLALPQGLPFDFNPAASFISMVLNVCLLFLLIFTVRAYSRDTGPLSRKRICGLAAGWLLYFLSLIPITLPNYLYYLLTSFLLWGRLALFTVLLVISWSYFRHWWKNRV